MQNKLIKMKRIETFQNLLVIVVADGIIADIEKKAIDELSYQLGITDEEYARLIKQIGQLEFIIPQSKEEAFQELNKMALICLSDGELSKEEECELYKFASASGFSQVEFMIILNHVYDNYNTTFEDTIVANKEIYDTVLNQLRSSGKSDQEIGKVFYEVIKKRDLDYQFSNDSIINHSFYCLLWLVYCRYVKISDAGLLVFIMMMIELVNAGECTLDDLFIDLKLAEDLTNEAILINIIETDTDILKSELIKTFPFFCE